MALPAVHGKGDLVMSTANTGKPAASSGSSIIATSQPSGGGGGGIITVEQAGTPIVTDATKLNFTSGATVTDGGGGVADIDVTGGGGGGASVSQLPITWTDNAIQQSDDVDLVAIGDGNLFTFTAMRAGSIVGMSSGLNAPITTGSLTLHPTINDAPIALSIVQTPTSNPQTAHVTQASGVATYAAGDLIGIHAVASANFEPTDPADTLWAWLEVSESLS
jgi:hypothetical protein